MSEQSKQLWRNVRMALYNTLSALLGALAMFLTGGTK